MLWLSSAVSFIGDADVGLRLLDVLPRDERVDRRGIGAEGTNERGIVRAVEAVENDDAIAETDQVVDIPRRPVLLKLLAAEAERVVTLLREPSTRCEDDDAASRDRLCVRQ